jgi:NAD+ synthase
MRELNLDDEITRIIVFIKGELAKVGYNKILVGLSGGIDSSVVAALCVKTIGKENVIGVMMPYRESHPDSLAHAKEVAVMLEIQYDIINISPMVDSYFEKYAPDADFLRRGNRIARERMCVLYDLSAKYKARVAGTGNKSELMVGYCTQYGDNACAFETIGHLYKNEVRKIAKILNISQEIINKNPSADLWENQTDEVEMGISYSRLDEILYNLIDLKKSEKKIKELGFSQDEIGKVQRMIKNSEFKRRIPPTIK